MIRFGLAYCSVLVITVVHLSIPCEARFEPSQFSIEVAEKWNWKEQRSSVIFYVLQAPAQYEIQLVRKPMANWPELEIRIRSGDQLIKFGGHSETNFVISDGILVYSEHLPIASGCKLTAVDIKSSKRLWSTELVGLGPVSHSKYRNQINLFVGDGKLRVHGKESGGNYVEHVDLRTGKTLLNQKVKG